jgi:anti-sigma B factor antagonist
MKEVIVQNATAEGLEIALVGEIASENAEAFFAEVIAEYEKCPADVTFVCEGLNFIDSTALGTFVKILKRVKTNGNKMRLVGLQAKIKKLFLICSLDTIMEIA